MKVVNILRSAISLILCVVALLACMNAADAFDVDEAKPSQVDQVIFTDEDYIVSDYEYYGGDAYTGIQHAGADAANNVAILGSGLNASLFCLHDAQRTTANNVAELAKPVNMTNETVVAIGTMLSNALVYVFALLAVKYLFDLIQGFIALKKPAVPEAAPENA